MRRLALLLVLTFAAACGSGDGDDDTSIVDPKDAGTRDTGAVVHDAGEEVRDAGETPRDGGEVARDAGETPRDAGEDRDGGDTARDAGEDRDGGETPRDAGPPPRDGGPPPRDAGPRDAGTTDSGTPDAGTPDAGTPDAGPSCNPSPNMTFFFTEQGSGVMGGNLGGLTGADAICQAAATAVGAGGRTWRAYLSALADPVFGRVDARDRIGAGPWFNYDGLNVGTSSAVHHLAGATGIPAALQKSECGYEITQDPNATLFARAHDILTGSDEFGFLQGGTGPTDPPRTCNDWTSSDPADIGWVGHEDTDFSSGFWNNAHPTTGCDQTSFAGTLSIGRIYCFATN